MTTCKGISSAALGLMMCCVTGIPTHSEQIAQPTVEVRNFRAVEVASDTLRVTVDYTFLGELPPGGVLIHATTQESGGVFDPRTIDFDELPVQPGTFTTTLTITKQAKARDFKSVAVRVCLSTNDSALLCRDYPYVKTWTSAGSPTTTPVPPTPPNPMSGAPPNPLSGAHTIQQRSNNRYLDAHDTPDRDFGVVVRPPQPNTTQRWIFRHQGGKTYTIRQQSTGRFLDAHDTPDRDFGVVTRPSQPDTTQRWLVTPLGGHVYAIQQMSTRRFLDAHAQDHDFAVVTRPRQQSSNTQRWIIR